MSKLVDLTNLKKRQGFDSFEVDLPRETQTQTWTMSYGDIVTVLLCFFIIFYAIEKQVEKEGYIEDSQSPINSTIYGPFKKEMSLTEKGKSNFIEHKDDLEATFENAIESLRNLENIHIYKTSSFVDIYFKKIVFFKLGSYALTSQGKTIVDEVVDKLGHLDGKYYLEIQGHTDKTPVKSLKSRWWSSNMELSVLRALDVYKYLIGRDFNKSQLAVSGYGHNKTLDKTISNKDFNRRISLRLQLKK